MKPSATQMFFIHVKAQCDLRQNVTQYVSSNRQKIILFRSHKKQYCGILKITIFISTIQYYADIKTIYRYFDTLIHIIFESLQFFAIYVK